MDVIDELKTMLLKVGVGEDVVNTMNPYWPLAGRIVDSIEYIEFVVAVEERYGIRILDPESAFVRSLNDFKVLIEEKS